jgi:dephospho-CoA kinase
MRLIAITGGIACGKSVVGRQLEDWGIPVCETDLLGHAVLAPGEAVCRAVLAEFGAAVAAPDGGVDRAALGRLVFADEARRQRLNALTHPEIMRRLDDWLARRRGPASVAAAIIPLLYEIGAEASWEAVVCVASPEEDQRRRLAERGLAAEEVRQRLEAQWPQAEKMERADYVIYNCGSLTLLKEQTARVVRAIRGE